MIDTQQNTDLPWTGERYVPQIRGTVALEHLHRYAFASEHVAGKVVLDIASGEGYGSEMLSRTAKHVYGVDIDDASVKHAQQKYTAENLEYHLGTCTAIPLPDASVDIVVSFETIEHITDHEKMMEEVKRVLRPGGVLIISSPEKHEYSVVPKHQNPFHLKELNQEEFKGLINKHFKYSSYLGQRVLHGSTLVGIEGDISVAKTYDFSSLPENIQVQKGISRPVYILAICSDQKLKIVTGSLCEQNILESEFCAEQIEKNSLLNKERDNLIYTISEKESVIASLKGEVANLDSQNQELIVQVSEKEGVIAEKEGVIAEKENRIKMLENQLREKKEAFAGLYLEMSMLRNSLSWKATQPLRYVMTYLIKSKKIFLRLNVGIRIFIKHHNSEMLDSDWYLKANSGHLAKKWIALLHFSFIGIHENRPPNPNFNSETYLTQNRDVLQSGLSPYIHYALWGYDERRITSFTQEKNHRFDNESVNEEHELEDSPSFEVLSGNHKNKKINTIAKDKSKIICFYLPQFHYVKENSEWWGEGFTEWTNTAKGKPNFEGHYQPHIPKHLGFYDLSNIETTRKQCEMAKSYGIYGFCYYYYWFSGRKILEKPLDNFISSNIDFPFCLCWANENWTKRWDGRDQDILLEQKYLDNDPELFIDSISKYISDRRYIKVNGKPVIIVYRAKELPDAEKVFKKWRSEVKNLGYPGIHIIVVDFYDITTPEEVAADALVEFLPHKYWGPENFPDIVPPIINKDFVGHMVDYKKMMSQSINRDCTSFKIYRGIIPGWDNTARRQNSPLTVINNTPFLFKKWLEYLRYDTRMRLKDREDNFIFVNAWNEWAEGAHLEPDIKNGTSYLESVLASSYYLEKE